MTRLIAALVTIRAVRWVFGTKYLEEVVGGASKRISLLCAKAEAERERGTNESESQGHQSRSIDWLSKAMICKARLPSMVWSQRSAFTPTGV